MNTHFNYSKFFEPIPISAYFSFNNPLFFTVIPVVDDDILFSYIDSTMVLDIDHLRENDDDDEFDQRYLKIVEDLQIKHEFLAYVTLNPINSLKIFQYTMLHLVANL